MRLTKSSFRRAALTVAATGLITGSMLIPSMAQAAPTTVPIQGANASSAATLSVQLGASAAGSYYDSALGNMVINVTDAAAASKVRATGAVAKVVSRSAAQLDRATAELDASARIVGTAWAVDPVSNQVLVSVDSSVSAANLARVQAVVGRLGGAARIEQVAGTFQTRITGGDAIYSSGYRCSLGFNVRSGSTYYFLTAGHCGNLGTTWYANSSQSTVLGTRTGTSFPGNDYAIIRYTNTSISHPGKVDLYNGSTQDITQSGNAYVGESVLRSGSTTGVHSGSVTALNATVNYSEGTVYGLIRTTVCAEGGDSGGSLFDGSTALGLTSGGSGNCSSGGTTFFQPVTEALSVYGVSVY